MKFLSLLFLLPNISLAYEFQDKENLFKKFEHKNYGCPINSDCSKENGELIQAWEKMLSMADSKSVGRMIRKFKKIHGIPLEFLTNIESKKTIDPILYKSRCAQHNPKNPNNKIFKGTKFLTKTKKSELMIFDKVLLYSKDKAVEFSIPYQDIPIMIKDNKLIITKDYDDDFYQLAVSSNGDLEVLDFKIKTLKRAMNKRIKEVKCPSKMTVDKRYHQNTYCQKIWDADTKSLKTIQLSWSCP
jgi:hypothetical protein